MVTIAGASFGRFTVEDENECKERIVTRLSQVKLLDKPITINISGLRFEVRKSTLEAFPLTLLGSEEREFFYDTERDEYFFERHRDSFEAILYYYQSGGLLVIPHHINADVLGEELRFFRIGNEEFVNKLTGQQIVDTITKTNLPAPEHPLKKRIWMAFSDPESGWAGRYLHYIDTIVIMIAIATQCIETLPQFDHFKQLKINGTPTNDQPIDMQIFFGIEVSCISWFTTDFLVRLILCPDKKEFLKSISNWIDFISIMPFYLSLILNSIKDVNIADTENNTTRDTGKVNVNALMILRITRILRVIRIARVFKMSRRFTGLFALGYALKTGAQELVLLVVLLSTCVVLFSNLVFFANESDPNSEFKSVIDAFWWSVVTMSTVGYGDQVPTTAAGKLVGCITALTGILVIALPFPIIVSRFNRYYELQKRIKGSGNLFGSSDNPSKLEFHQPSFGGVIVRVHKDEQWQPPKEEKYDLQYFCDYNMV